jgi:predicted RNA binding protein YcfA (HicA-like mRNA interferase family)
MMKCTDRKTLIKILKQNGFSLDRHGKHDIFISGVVKVVVPNKTKGFSRVLAERLLKEAGILNLK